MKFGLKMWSVNWDMLLEAEKLIKKNIFQYIELTPILDTEMEYFLSYNIPFIIHVTTEAHGFNISDKKKEKHNFKTLNKCIQWADDLNAKNLILHPGFGSIDSTLEFLSRVEDTRILIENMPKIGENNEKMAGYSPEQISELMGSKFGFCFDFNHAIKASISLKEDYKKYIRKFMELDPFYFHIADGMLDNEKDEHMNIGEGQYNFELLLQCLMSKSDNYATLETPRINLKSFDEDCKNLKEIYNYLYGFNIK